MKSLLELWRTLAEELASWFGVSTTLDLKTVESRIEHEAYSFLTITLPQFGKDFEQALAREEVTSDLWTGYRRSKGSRLPSFLSGFTSLVFDSNTGLLLEEPDHIAIFSVRQLTLLFGKIHLECSQDRIDGAVVQYLKTESEVEESSLAWRLAKGPWITKMGPESYAPTQELRSRVNALDPLSFERMSNLLFGDILAKINQDVYEHLLVPKHGPGKTADRLSGNAKFDQQEWTQRLEGIFPYGEYVLPNWRFNYRLDSVTFLSPEQERPVRVVLVPKTLKTPRVIAIEPTCMQYMQQAIAKRLVSLLEDDKIIQRMIGFTEQGPNQDLAREGSLNGSLATLDLSEASDRVSNEHVRSLFRHHSWLLNGVDACRSRKARVPGYFGRPSEVIELSKFASMGSALTFPVEAMVFLTIIALTFEKERGRQYRSREVLSRDMDGVRVYGDDIIVPTHVANSVIDNLELFGYKVNASKSFWTGKFRESCGKEYFAGSNVSITRVGKAFPQSRKDVREIVSLVELRNRFYLGGLWQTAKFLEGEISRFYRLSSFPAIQETSPLVGRVSFLRSSEFTDGDGWDSDLHCPVVQGLKVVSKPPASAVSGEGALLKWFIKEGNTPFEMDHLERSGRPDAVYLKRRCAKPF